MPVKETHKALKTPFSSHFAYFYTHFLALRSDLTPNPSHLTPTGHLFPRTQVVFPPIPSHLSKPNDATDSLWVYILHYIFMYHQ